MLPEQTIQGKNHHGQLLFLVKQKLGIVVDLPRGGVLMMGVLTLFCSLQRLKVCLIASMANRFRLWSQKELWRG